jgi:hypothetical protein
VRSVGEYRCERCGGEVCDVDADVRAYQAEDAAFEAAHRKRRREARKAERAAAPPAPERAQPPRASKRARASA